ncbi:MAG: histone deacetylase family protein [Solirubrobacteraceae bacterium]
MCAAPLYLRHDASLRHDPGERLGAHPEAPERIVAIERALAARDWLGWERASAPAATVAELELVHTAAHVQAIERLCAAGGGAIDADTAASERSYEAALHAAGGACELVRVLLSGERRLGFCGQRPPGHHAEAARAMGFCLFNNVAIAAALAIARLGADRVFVLDWDVHHGNGTAETFRRRADVLYASIHQQGLFPGTGALGDVGSDEGEGFTINLPVPAGAGDELWLSLLEHIAIPAAAEFQPSIVLVSAGFDAHRADPLASCTVSTAGFAHMACHVRELARTLDAPLGAVLEGGYDPEASAQSVCATLAAFAGEGEAVSAAPEPLLTARAASRISRYWSL